MTRRYVVLDVFTDRPLAGNPLAVVLDAEGLDTAAMQAIAREFNLSETVFVSPAERPGHSAALRIFTPGREVPFAGHPTIGTAVLLAEERFGRPDRGIDAMVVMEEKVGAIRAAVRLDPKRATYAEFDAPRLPKPIGFEAPGKGVIADALGLETRSIGFENHQIALFDAGLPYAFVPLADLEAIGRVRFDKAAWRRLLTGADGEPDAYGVYLYCRESVRHDSAFHARMFDVGFGIDEDPATGSAAAAFAGVVTRFDTPTTGTHRLTIEQGFEMGRPSLIDLTIEIAAGDHVATRIGGAAVRVAEGMLLIPPGA
jgi:trans-2,3-dihydro-3-hydroxyanthranilate isomerase